MRHAVVMLALTACDAGLDQRLAIIDEPRILAIVADPPEVKPGGTVTYRAIVASPDGPIAAAPRWSFCTASKPPTEDNAVSTPCVTGDALVELGTAGEVTAALPVDGCIRFGPDTPSQMFRPRDPDPTGGYYQPLRADVDALLAIALSRITCKLPNAIAEVARDYDLNYHANKNPVLQVEAPATVPAQSAVTLTVTWSEESAESYLYFDQLSQGLVERREALRVSWFATGGTIDVDASAVAEGDFATTVETTWHTPGPGPATLWFVLRDSRGGIATAAAPVTVE